MIHPLSRSTAVAVVCLSVALGLPVSHALADNTFKTIRTFDTATDGNVPYACLIQGADAKLYGTNSADGKNSNGTIFSVRTDGTGFLVLSSFPGTNAGVNPQGNVVQARDGNFYGTTFAGGSNGVGTFFQVTPAGTLTFLSVFNNGASPGANPAGNLIEGIDGNIYGTAKYGGTDNYGTVFKATVPAGALSTFATITGGTAGDYPEADLLQTPDGNFYGTCSASGEYSNGAFFQLASNGTFQAFYSFTGSADGGTPIRGVVQGADGAFYGANQTGGLYSSGAIYRISVGSSGAVQITPLYSFNPAQGDGSTPDGALVAASDGNLYGTTAFGGANNLGTIFKVTTTGGFKTVYSFTGGTDGESPVGGLLQANDGKLYGTTAGQNGASGTIFKIDVGLTPQPPAQLTSLSSSTMAGDTILVKGLHLVGTTAVNFTGANNSQVAAASFTVESATIVSVVVPTGAMNGNISLTANGLSATTTTPITVVQPVILPNVSITATKPTASEPSTNGAVQFMRDGSDFSTALVVNFKISGNSTAQRGTDYHLTVGKGSKEMDLSTTTNSVTIPAGRPAITIMVVPYDVNTGVPSQTIDMKLKAGTGYNVNASAHKATVTIIDD